MRAAQSCPLFNVNLASWNVARVLDASTMFNYASGNRPPNNPFRSSFSQLIAEALVLFARATIRRRADQCGYRDGRAWILNALEAYISSNALRFSIRVGRSACTKSFVSAAFNQNIAVWNVASAVRRPRACPTVTLDLPHPTPPHPTVGDISAHKALPTDR